MSLPLCLRKAPMVSPRSPVVQASCFQGFLASRHLACPLMVAVDLRPHPAAPALPVVAVAVPAGMMTEATKAAGRGLTPQGLRPRLLLPAARPVGIPALRRSCAVWQKRCVIVSAGRPIP